MHERIYAGIFVLNSKAPRRLSSGSSQEARMVKTSSHGFSYFGFADSIKWLQNGPLTPMSSNSKSAKTTERPAKKTKHRERKVSFLVASTPNKIQNVSSKSITREIVTSSETLKPAVTSGKDQESSSFKIIAGSYERLLYGLQGTVSAASPASSELEWTLKPIFIFPAHVSYIKSVAASPQGGKWLATGSGDEIIKIWDLRRRKEVGGLMQHEGRHSLMLDFPSTLRELIIF
jgi:protein MAK11